MRGRDLATALVLCALTACGGGGGEKSRERLRVFHAAPNFDPLDISIAESSSSSSSSSSATARVGTKSEELTFSALPYGQSTSYVDVVEGTARIRVETEQSVLPIIDETKTIAAGKDYTYVLYEESAALKSVLQEDDNRPPEGSRFRLRIGNFSPSAGAVDVYLYHPGDDLNDVSPVASNLAVNAFSTYLEVAAGTYRVKFLGAGGTTLTLDAGRLELEAGDVATLFLLDEEGGGEPLSVALLLDEVYN